MDILRAPVDSPFTTDQLQYLTSPAWLAYFVRQLTPAVNELIGNMDPPDVPLGLAKDYPRANDGSGLNLPLGGNVSRETRGEMPPPHPSVRPSDSWPPPAPQRQPATDLVMGAAVQFGRALPVWLVSDTAANITKYPPSAYPPNALFLATDTSIFYHNTGNAWVAIPFGQIVTSPTVSLRIGGSATGITGTQVCSCVQTGKNVVLTIAVTLTNKGVGTGDVTLVLGTIPAVAGAGTGILTNLANFLVLTSPVAAYLPASSTTITLSQTGATGSATLQDTNLTNTSSFELSLTYTAS